MADAVPLAPAVAPPLALRSGPPARPIPPATRILAALAGRLRPITLEEMDDVALLSRFDVKYILDAGRALAALAAVMGRYRVLDVHGVRLNRYRTLYFDTPARDLYAAHQAGRADRYKIRSRAYLDSGLSYLEVKHKTNKGRTEKARLATPALLTDLSGPARTFVATHYPAADPSLAPALWNTFERITLVATGRSERATIDVHLRFRSGASALALPGLVVVEIKQESPSRDSALAQALRALGVRPGPFSKYGVGVALLHPEAKQNRLKPTLRRLVRITQGEGHA